MHISPPGSHHRRNCVLVCVHIWAASPDDVGSGVSFAEPSRATLKGVSVKRRIEFITPTRRGGGRYTQPSAISQEWIFLYTDRVFSPDNGKWHYCYSICFSVHTLITPGPETPRDISWARVSWIQTTTTTIETRASNRPMSRLLFVRRAPKARRGT